LFSSGRLHWLLQAWQRTQVLPVVNRATTTELLRVLAYPKFRLSRAEQEDILAEYLPYCELTSAISAEPIPEVRDAADTKFLQLAFAAQVPYIVTGDGDLLALAITGTKASGARQFEAASGTRCLL
jgi:putative PIN family toxin of toxin-antitoxin system